MNEERYRLELFASDNKREYLRTMALTIVLREWNVRMDNCHSIYRGGGADKLNLSANGEDYSYSFSDGLFGGLVYDCIDGMAFRYTKAGYCHIKDLPIKEYGQVLSNKRSVFIPPVPALAAALGVGEYHHPRTPLSEEAIKTGNFKGLSFFDHNAKQIPPSMLPLLTNQGATCADNDAACADLFKDVKKVSLYDRKNRERVCFTII